MKKQKKKKEFSKILVAQESALMWITTISIIILAYICIDKQYFGELPWLTAMVAFPWTAYGVSQGFYYNKAKTENKIKLAKKYDINPNDIMDYPMEPCPGQAEPFEGIDGVVE